MPENLTKKRIELEREELEREIGICFKAEFLSNCLSEQKERGKNKKLNLLDQNPNLITEIVKILSFGMESFLFSQNSRERVVLYRAGEW